MKSATKKLPASPGAVPQSRPRVGARWLTVPGKPARLVVVRLKPNLPWCFVDPFRWNAAGSPGEMAMLNISNNYHLFFYNFTITAYHPNFEGTPPQTLLRLDSNITFLIGCRSMEARHRRLFERHPELRVRFRTRDTGGELPLVFAPGRKGYAPGFPQVRRVIYAPVPKEIITDGEVLVLVEPVMTLIRAMGLKEKDLFRQVASVP